MRYTTIITVEAGRKGMAAAPTMQQTYATLAEAEAALERAKGLGLTGWIEEEVVLSI